jgi:hypothetical protein
MTPLHKKGRVVMSFLTGRRVTRDALKFENMRCCTHVVRTFRLDQWRKLVQGKDSFCSGGDTRYRYSTFFELSNSCCSIDGYMSQPKVSNRQTSQCSLTNFHQTYSHVSVSAMQVHSYHVRNGFQPPITSVIVPYHRHIINS